MKKLLIVTLLCSIFACSEQEAVCTLAESKVHVSRGRGVIYIDYILVENIPKDREELKRLMIYHFLHTAYGMDTLQADSQLYDARCFFVKSTPKTRKYFKERKEHVYGEFLDRRAFIAKAYIGGIVVSRCENGSTKMTVVLGLLFDGIDRFSEESEDDLDLEQHVLLNECEPDWYETNKNIKWVKYYTEEANKKALPGTIDTGRFIDERDGKAYKTTVIGGKKWMAENLNYKTSNSWCYDGHDFWCETYGRLYDWNTAMTVCPEGWHLPSGQEWDSLVTTAGGDRAAAKKLKAVSSWPCGPGKSCGGTDDYGFSALPGGSSYKGDKVFYIRDDGQWWTAAEYGNGYAYYRNMTFNNDRVREYGCVKGCGVSVRCIHD
jgi:uncharacterized protein (TIGR02145 family)